jgi:hypothetical protein
MNDWPNKVCESNDSTSICSTVVHQATRILLSIKDREIKIIVTLREPKLHPTYASPIPFVPLRAPEGPET